jgi:endo-1,4-beta-D-glucanase Y
MAMGRAGRRQLWPAGRQSATDADLWIALRVGRSGPALGHPGYLARSNAVGDLVLRQSVAELPGLGPVLLPAPQGFGAAPGPWRLNPGYLPIQVLRGLAAAHPDQRERWLALLASSVAVLHGAAPGGIAPDWVRVDDRGAFTFDDGAPATGSYGAIRVYLWLGMLHAADPERAALLRRFQPMARVIRRAGQPPERIDVLGGRVLDANAPGAFSAAVAPWLEQAEARAARRQWQRAMQLAPAREEYFGRALLLLAQGWREGRLRFGPDGELLRQESMRRARPASRHPAARAARRGACIARPPRWLPPRAPTAPVPAAVTAPNTGVDAARSAGTAALFDSAQLWRQRGRDDLSRAALLKLLSSAPGDRSALCLLMAIEIEASHLDEAARLLVNLERTHPDAEEIHVLGELLDTARLQGARRRPLACTDDAPPATSHRGRAQTHPQAARAQAADRRPRRPIAAIRRGGSRGSPLPAAVSRNLDRPPSRASGARRRMRSRAGGCGRARGAAGCRAPRPAVCLGALRLAGCSSGTARGSSTRTIDEAVAAPDDAEIALPRRVPRRHRHRRRARMWRASGATLERGCRLDAGCRPTAAAHPFGQW